CGWCAAGVLYSRISGAEVELEIRVRPGDEVTLYCDCVWEVGFKLLWFRNCSHQHQPPLIISATAQDQHARLYDGMQRPLTRYSFVWNSSSSTHDLQVKNVSESDLGLYYCALREKKVTEDETGVVVRKDVYRYGNRTTRLSLLGRKKLRAVEAENTENLKSSELSKPQVGEDGVCYASLDLPPRREKRLKKKRVESSEFSTYSEETPPHEQHGLLLDGSPSDATPMRLTTATKPLNSCVRNRQRVQHLGLYFCALQKIENLPEIKLERGSWEDFCYYRKQEHSDSLST
ncbi:hypothetical protein NFI96_028220, partial [Prochilodus magdalenae]